MGKTMADSNILSANFYSFTGVVEDRNDPQKLGRYKVRVLGIHTHDKEILPTADLPWAQCILPVTSPGISGLGHSPSFLVEGSWVFGYMRDGTACQQPVIIGSLPGYPIEGANSKFGFYDPNEKFPRMINEPDTNRLAVNLQEAVGDDLESSDANPHLHLVSRTMTRLYNTGIATADFNTTINADGGIILGSDGDTWDQPKIPYAAVYPYNHVFESESGHISEWDDTPGAERIYQAHRTGTSYEVDPIGNITVLNQLNKYEITSWNSYNSIGGDSDITIDGRHKIYINKSGMPFNNYDIQIGPNANVNIQVDKGNINLVTVDGNINVNSGGDYNLRVKGNYVSDIWGSKRETIAGSKTSNTTMSVIHRGATIDLN
jgi:hypothetical protein